MPDPEYLAERRAQRERTQFSIWAPSPTASADEACKAEEDEIIAKLQERIDERNRGSHNDGNASDTGTHSSFSSSSDDDDMSESRSERSNKRHRRRRRHQSDYSDSGRSSDNNSDSEGSQYRSASTHARKSHRKPESKDKPKSTDQPSEHMSDEEIGPMPSTSRVPALSERMFGGALLPGEGSAMSAFVQSGERIPRRGEIGVDQDMIERLENSGYVMSGNRHRRMNAVRVRKENQVISTEEKRQMLLQNQEERVKKETMIISEFRSMLSKKQ
ncbi:hypothetical protein GGI04_000903 [Coemansia thaxteri]|nr:hypothetical protein GGI04_000903 [Coemansia thaxteri]KAJ2473762.1 hypothetical protein GGI02_000634 [Coemansia sp. RSA 2322]